MPSLNAPFGARCFLTCETLRQLSNGLARLNAPFGTRCFLTQNGAGLWATDTSGLNAPYGARCFLTARGHYVLVGVLDHVLMHRMALGAF